MTFDIHLYQYHFPLYAAYMELFIAVNYILLYKMSLRIIYSLTLVATGIVESCTINMHVQVYIQFFNTRLQQWPEEILSLW